MGKSDKGFCLFYDWVAALDFLNPEEAWAVVKLLRDYHVNGNDSMDALSPSAKAVAYNIISEAKRLNKDAENGRKGAEATNGKRKGSGSVSAGRQPPDSPLSAPRQPPAATETETETETKTETKTKTQSETAPPSSPPKGEDAQIGGRFERFWAAYPKKVAKAAALKAWKSLSPDEGLLETILDALERQKKSDQWRRENGQFIPNPSTWINGKRWNDELTPRNSRYCESTDDSELLTIQC